jgi:hypothetical protein
MSGLAKERARAVRDSDLVNWIVDFAHLAHAWAKVPVERVVRPA